MTGRIIKLLSGVYTVRTPEGDYLCRARGSFRKHGIAPVPGDKVEILSMPDSTGRIDRILPRKNYLIRPNVANIDILCYISSYGQPVPSAFTIDKMLLIAQNQNIEPVLIFNKTDLLEEGSAGGLMHLYRSLGYCVFETSALEGEGLEPLKVKLADKTVVFAGNTGVGKSSILNGLFPSLALKTGEISQKLGRGRHTTRHIELYPINNALIGDTPGFGALDLEGYQISRKALPDYFPEFKKFIPACRYPDCSHIGEQACAIRAAVADGQIAASRYESYCQIYRYLKEEENSWNKKTSRS